MKYTAKRAAMVILEEWLAGGTSVSPWFMTRIDMEHVCREFGCVITEKRRTHILEQVDKIVNPLKKRVRTFLESN